MEPTADTNGRYRVIAPERSRDSRTSFHHSRPDQPEIIGRNPKLLEALRQAEVVAVTDCTTIVLGETGTGKELVAKMIHEFSPRRDHPFVTVNCAAMPIELLESELFGHERGAFTGAVAQRIGRFELADKGTLFLDEVGDLPPQLQPKLLRVLQERQFERLGSTRTINADIRLVAATHCNLSRMVKEGTFREDLFYRLNVFPIQVPPLRERREDISLLVRHFTRKYAEALNRKIDAIPSDAMEIMTQYSWPGNIRELQNFIERAVILSNGPVLNAPFAELMPRKDQASIEPVTLKEAERAHIIRTLRKTNGQIAGAAALLGVPRTTLFYMMRRLGISFPGTGKSRKIVTAA